MKYKIIYCLAGLVLMVINGFSAQTVFIDDIITWTKDAYDYPRQLGDTNWVSPVNYRDGSIHVRYEAIEKPSTKNIALQLCFWQDGYAKESCSACNNYSQKGVYYLNLGRPGGFGGIKGGGVDWFRKFQAMYFMHKDGSCGSRILMTSACGSACYTKSDIDQHVPITYKMLAVVVSAGSSFQPPPGWNSPITVAAPEFSRPGGTYPERFYLELSCPTPDAQIFYSSTTTNVTVGSNRYQRPLGIGSKRTVSARAFKSGYYSPVVTMTYEIEQTNIQYPTLRLRSGQASNVQCPMDHTQVPRNMFDISGKPVRQGQQEPGIYLKRVGNRVERILVIQ